MIQQLCHSQHVLDLGKPFNKINQLYNESVINTSEAK